MQAEVKVAKLRDAVNTACYRQHMAATYIVTVEMHKNLMGCMRANNGFMLT
jgi:hypothetical protein